MLCEQEVARERGRRKERKELASRMWVNGDVGPGSDYSEGWKLIESGERKKELSIMRTRRTQIHPFLLCVNHLNDTVCTANQSVGRERELVHEWESRRGCGGSLSIRIETG